jgi:hypothetical protein
MLKYNKNVYRVGNSLDPKTFIYRVDNSGNKPTVGWVGMMAWRVDDLKCVSAPIKTFIEKNDLKFHHSGIMLDKPHWIAEALNIDSDRVTGFTGARPQYYGHIFMPIDIGIVPLTQNQFNEAKSSLKGMEYALSGIPFVASDTQEYRDLADAGAGRIAKTNKDWLKHLNALLDPEVRLEERQKNFSVVANQFNIYLVKYKWSEAIELIHMKSKKEKKINLLTAV